MSTADNNSAGVQPCANPECNFHGHESYSNYCSLCYKTKKDEGQLVTPREEQKEEVVKMQVDEEQVSKEVVATVSTEGKDEEDKPPVKKQKNRKRCFECKKKVGLTGIECRCGFVYCGLHRDPDVHNCEVDFKSFYRNNLEKANQKVVADKLEKL
mmetsp:Transcript_12880/g.27586  ORF Transcript_12880/g.27586 Transcript_12880/m.27586 type:complete len:155 (-) Transcript_12880:92-556(-)